MRALLTVLAAGGATYVLRASCILWAHRLEIPPEVRRCLQHSPPAILAAIVATGIAGGAGPAALLTPSPVTVAAVVSGLVAWRRRTLLAPVLAGVAAVVVLTALWS